MISYDDSCLMKLSAKKGNVKEKVVIQVAALSEMRLQTDSPALQHAPFICSRKRLKPYHLTLVVNLNKTLPCFGCNRCCKVPRTTSDRWHISPTSQIANCMISSAKNPRLQSPRQYPLAVPNGSHSPSPFPRLVNSNRSWDPRRLAAAQILQSALASSHC